MPSLIRFSMSNRLAYNCFRGDLRFNLRRFLNIYRKLLPKEELGSYCGECGWNSTT
jgi:hypothetical protein